MLQVRLKHAFPARPGSRGFSLDLAFEARPGVTVLFGPSGSGKTLTLDSIAGFATPTAGRILLDDSILFDGETRVNLPPQARRCGYVFQNYALFPHMTLADNLAFAAHALPPRERARQVKDSLEQFQLTDVAARRPGELSGGQKQRGSIARALLRAPRMLLLDEPAQGLDAPLRQELYSILRSVRAQYETPIVLVTHSLEECFELGDSLQLISEGHIIQSGTPRQVLDHPASPEAARLLGVYTLLPAEIRALDPGRQTSRIRCLDHDLNGPYYPSHFIGDRITLCLLPSVLRALPRFGAPAENQIPATLERVAERPHSVILHFAEGLSVEMPRSAYEPLRQTREWLIEFPPAALRIL